ncbi:MAG: hypothetical protein WD068_03470 [Candidatus Babeliales bacterium]
MSKTVKLPEDFLKEVKRYAEIENRSVPKQIEHWSRIGKIAIENPDLPYEFIAKTLRGLKDIEDGNLKSFSIDELK